MVFAAAGQEATTDPSKRSYTLFNPTPEALMRELSADRPDKTESAHTVDAGHFQLEMDLANLTSNKPDTTAGTGRTTAYEVAPMNLKIGLLNNLDVQLGFIPFRWERERGIAGGPAEVSSGFSGVTPRIKLSLVGNDEGLFALALLPFAAVSTQSDTLGEHRLDGGLKIPFAFRVPGWDLSAMTEADAVRNERDRGHHWILVNSLSLGRPLFGRFSGYGEFFSSVTEERGAGWIGTANFWITYQANKNLRLDAGVYIGVTSAAEDWHPFLGLTWRY